MNLLPVFLFVLFVGTVLWLSFYFAKQTKSAKGYFAAGGEIHWAVNGIAFAGDYLSAASFLGICGMIATVGYDGFLYSIGYLAGWIVALFVVAEPMKRLGKYTFTDKHIVSKEGVYPETLKEYHSQILQLGTNILDTISKEERECRSMTLSFSAHNANKVKLKIKKFFKELAFIASEDKKPEDVFMVNLQFFKLTDSE